MISYEEIRNDKSVIAYIKAADASLASLGYTEHSFAHVVKVAEDAASLLSSLGYDEHTVELARIAGILHDIGNVVNRQGHSQSGALMAFRILEKMGMQPEDVAAVVTAIGNHDEGDGVPVSDIAAALIIADKSDVRRSRVREKQADFDIHDRVNYSVTSSRLAFSEDGRRLELILEIDTAISPVMEYFEIFLGRMLLCRKAADRLGVEFGLVINSQKII
ncbi:MAG: HD domain-containing protein [Clostridia bacterium]|nr:HD domain-containing protein [Clostridia bacterium]